MTSLGLPERWRRGTLAALARRSYVPANRCRGPRLGREQATVERSSRAKHVSGFTVRSVSAVGAGRNSQFTAAAFCASRTELNLLVRFCRTICVQEVLLRMHRPFGESSLEKPVVWLGDARTSGGRLAAVGAHSSRSAADKSACDAYGA